MTHHHGDILLVELPELIGNLPPLGNYTILGLAKDLTEAQWEEIVESDTRVDGYGFHHIATASGLSLVSKYGMKPGNCLILKKK